MTSPPNDRRRILTLARTAEWREPLLLLVLLAIAPIALDDYRTLSLGSFMPYAMAAAALALVWGYCGILSVGQASFYGLGAYAGAHTLGDHTLGLGVAIALSVTLVACAAVGWLMARAAFGVRLDVFLITVVTFSSTVILAQLAIKFTNITGGINGVTIANVLPANPSAKYYIAFAVFAVTLVCLVVLASSDAGRLIVGARDNATRLRFLGTDVDAVRRRVFTFGAVVTGFAGVLDVSYTRIASPAKIGFAFSALILLWCAIGGRRSLTAAAFGALAVNMVNIELSEQLLRYWQMVLAVAFIAIVMYLPDGLHWPLRKLAGRIDISETIEIASVAASADRPAQGVAIEAQNVMQRFGSFTALAVDDLVVEFGRITALIGPNGAGKTTLVNALSGGSTDATGTASFLGHELIGTPADAVARLGLARKFQSPNVFEPLQVKENLFISTGPATGIGSVIRRTRRLKLPPIAEKLLTTSGLRTRLWTEAAHLSHGEKQYLELCMVLTGDTAAVLLDEPTAGLGAADRAAVGSVLRSLADDGVAVVIIEHDFDFIRAVADRIVVMHQGRLIAHGTVADISRDPTVQALYVGAAS